MVAHSFDYFSEQISPQNEISEKIVAVKFPACRLLLTPGRAFSSQP